MLIIPAIDLLGGRVVRLRQGVASTAKVYGDDPLAVARRFEAAGARWVHVVDLDGAFGRPETNRETILRLIEGLSVPVELGGGIRSLERIDFWLGHGVGRIILGSLAVENPALVAEAVQRYGSESLVGGIDMKDGRVAVHGWESITEREGESLAKDLRSIGISRVVCTDIATDGMLGGPKLDRMIAIAEQTGIKVIVSGGISCLKDLSVVAEHARLGFEGVIVGRALYEGRIDLAEAIQAFQEGTAASASIAR